MNDTSITCSICTTTFLTYNDYNKHMPCTSKSSVGLVKTDDPVHHPNHYTAGGIEVIDYMKAKMTPEQFSGYLLGNVIKYVSRYRGKNGVQDLEKAHVYLGRLIEHEKPV